MKIAVFLSRFPYPLEKGDKLRAYHQIKHLSKEHDITLFATSDQKIEQSWYKEIEKYCHEIHLFQLSKVGLAFAFLRGIFSNKPFQVHYFYRKAFQRKIQAQFKAQQFDLIYCQLVRVAPYVTPFPNVKVIDYMDALSKGIDKRIAHLPFYKKWFFKIERKRLQRYEHILFDYFDGHTIISELDKKSILHQKQASISVIPNGIDADFFAPIKTIKKFDLVFTGNMSYPPNINASEYLVNNILPHIDTKIKVLLSGANPVPQVQSLAGRNVEVSGWVDDIRESYAKAKIFIAPMQIGTGMQNKILEAMAMEMPCIISSYTQKSIAGENNVHYIVCSTVNEYVAAIKHLQENPDVAQKMGKNARQFVLEKYNWQQSNEQLTTLFKKLV